ncbi:DNA-directed RNA polymerase sigma-70 factor [Adhaeribacter aerolatus]|uniref:DNA-directed RNA polymerase sigma-70 factor n=1 Tax=Adhaeribacter aerolatus TaxID=670289 RepID=A0A512AUM6_9BACT|nr:RNA polymerase sigma-70 factor [Adhaeribacter aerolatus]GEO03418.1 DNA-directed RNA polymerase sigma-70 factor [Adhaeribacter aerolatus]
MKLELETVLEQEDPKALLVKQEAIVTDNEAFIRQAFEVDPRQGCELLFHHYYQSLCSHAVRFLYAKAIAEDIVSEIFYQFYKKETYKQITSSYRAYLYKAVRNSAYNYLRWEANRSVELEACADISDLVCQQPDAIVQYEELYQDVEAAIDSLPSQCRKIYLMHRFENKKYAEIATELQLSPRTVEAQIRKASLFLKEILRQKWLLLTLLVCLA